MPWGDPLPPWPLPSGIGAVPQALAGGRPAMSGIFISPLARQPQLAVAVPMLRAGRARGVLVATMPTSLLDDALAHAGIPAGWHAALLDEAGQPIAGHLPHPANNGSRAPLRYMQAATQAPWTAVVEPQPTSTGFALAATAAALVAALAGVALAGRMARRVLWPAAPRAGPAQPASPFGAATPDGGDAIPPRGGAGREPQAPQAPQGPQAPQAPQGARPDAALTAFVQQAPHAIALLDRSMNYVAVSRLWLAAFGSGREDITGLNHYDLIPDLPEAWKEVHRRAQAGETVRNDCDHWQRADGSEVWYRWLVQPWTDETGAIRGVLIDFEDITAQQQALRRAREAHESFEVLFRHAPVALVVGKVGSGVFVEVNAAFVTLSGYAREEVLGRSSCDFDLWLDPNFRATVDERRRREGSVPPIESTLRRKSGELVEVSFSSRPVEIAGEVHFLSMIADMTAQQQVRRSLERHQAELEALVERRTAELQAANAALEERAAAITDLYDRAPCGYHSLAPDDTLLSVNATWLAMLGYQRHEVIGQPLTRFCTPASRERFEASRAETVKSGSAHDHEYDMVRKDGTVLPVLMSAVIVRDAEGRHVADRATMVDNSERKARQAQIEAMQLELARRADDAEAATRAKSAFLANMSHEIRTPMNAVLGLTHLLARDAREPLARTRLAKIDGAARHLLQVINDILDLSKIEAGKMTLEVTDFSLDEMVARAFEMVGARAREKGLELVLDSSGAPDALRGDPTRLAQALINLLANAVKFTQRGWVRLRVERLAGEGPGVVLRFEVRDTGIGIAPDVLPSLFGAFEQADTSTSRQHGGTGLGLALTRHVARMMGGEAGVESRLGEGSCFWFTARLHEGQPTSAPGWIAGLSGRRALLVDELPESQQALAARLRSLGLAVDTFGSADAAAAQARERERADARAGGQGPAAAAYDLLLLACGLPPNDLQALARLSAQVGSPPALLLTSSDDAALAQQARGAGFAAVLLKPVTPSTLLDALALALHLRSPGRAAAPRTTGDAMEREVRASRSGRRVLVAEDNPINQEVASELLRAAGLVVETAADGHEAVERALEGHFDLVLMDVQMPGVDGLEATRRIRSAGRKALPIVAMTANAFGEDRQACLAAGMNDHVAKPVDPERLYAKLVRWLPATQAAPAASGASAAPSATATSSAPSSSSAASSCAPLAASLTPLILPTPAPPPLAPLHDRLAAIPGIDVGQAMRVVGGQVTLLRRVLERFVQAYGARELGPLDAARAHSLRGACATIGAVHLASVLHDYERAARSDGADAGEMQQQAAVIAAEFRELIERLRAELARG